MAYAASAPEALAKLQSFRPHVLVSDIGLPGEDGYDLLRKVRALNAADGGTTPAVALTGYAREQDHKAALAAGYQEFVAKPVNLAELSNAIEIFPVDKKSPQSMRIGSKGGGGFTALANGGAGRRDC